MFSMQGHYVATSTDQLSHPLQLGVVYEVLRAQHLVKLLYHTQGEKDALFTDFR